MRLKACKDVSGAVELPSCQGRHNTGAWRSGGKLKIERKGTRICAGESIVNIGESRS